MSRAPSRKHLLAALLPLVLVGACGGGETAKTPVEPKAADAKPGDGAPQATSLVTNGAPAPAGDEADAPDPESADQVYARVRTDLVACYEQGKRAVPAMTSGKVTLNVAVDPGGKPSCVVASDDSGLTQEVEDCMSARMTRETFKTSAAPWATELPIVVNGGKVSLGPPAANAPALETVETHGLPDSAHEIVEALLPRLHECTAGTEAKPGLRVMHVGARVGKTGQVECALASSASPLPSKMRECAASTLAGAKFPAPRSKVGLVSVPVKILARK